MKSQEGRRLCGRCARRAGGAGGFLFLNGLCDSNLPFHDLERSQLGYFRRPDQGKIGDLADGTSVIRSLIVRGGDQGGASEQNNGQQRNGGLHLPMGYSPDGATTEHIPINTLVDPAELVNGLVSAASGLLWFTCGLPGKSSLPEEPLNRNAGRHAGKQKISQDGQGVPQILVFPQQDQRAQPASRGQS